MQLNDQSKKFSFTAKTAGLTLSMAFVYFVFATAGLELATLNQSVSPVWPATGFAFAALYLFGIKNWPAILLGAFAANYFGGSTLPIAFAIAIGNTLEAVVGTLILRRVQNYHNHFSHQTDTLAFLCAAIGGSLVSASMGVFVLSTMGLIPPELIGFAWLTWWVGDTLGGLVVAPMLIYLKRSVLSKINWLQFSGLLAASLLVVSAIFFTASGGAYLFLLFPVLLYAALFLDKFSVVLFAVVLSAASIYATVNNFGPFATGTLNERLVHLQLFLSALAITALTLAGFEKKNFSRFTAGALLTCWALSGVLFYSFERSEIEQTENHFSTLVVDAEEKMLTVVKSYEDALRGGAGLLAASQSVQFKEWTSYTDALELSRRYPGLHGLGVAYPTDLKGAYKIESEMRKEGIEQYKIKPVPGYEAGFTNPERQHKIIKLIAPVAANIPALGLDLASEPRRDEALNTSRDTGSTAVSSSIVLVQDKKRTPGFLIFLPVYKKNVAVNTVTERRAAHLAWVFAPIISADYFAEVFAQTSQEIELQAFNGLSAEKDNLLFSNFSEALYSAPVTVSKIKLGQRDFTLHWKKSPKFVSSHDTIIAWVGFCGALASLLLTNLLISTQTVGIRSRELADELTKELKASKEKFKAGERRLLYALDGSKDGVWDWSIPNSEMYVSGKIVETHGWPQTFTVNTEQDLSLYTHPEDLSAIRKSINKVLKGQADQHEVETRYKTVRGGYRWVLTRGKISERDEKGRPTRMTGVHIDIHDLKNTQSLLEETQSHLKNIANSVPTMISLWNKDLICEFCNETFAAWVGRSTDALTGMHMRDVVGEEVVKDRGSLLSRALCGEALSYEREAIRPSDKSSRYILANYTPSKSSGKNDGFFLFVQDITEVKSAELAALKDRQAAIEATEIKSQFLANMSHEIRTPLNGIIGMAKLLTKTSLNAAQSDYSDVIVRSSQALLNIVNDVLDFSKAEAGKLDLEIVDFCMKDLISDIMRSLAIPAKEKNLLLQVETNFPSSEYFKGDPGRIRQVLSNLISNAVKFTPQGSITVKVERTFNGNEAQVHFEVIDTGIGIPDHALSKMFQAFSQADASMTRRFGGTGLGLSISKQLVDLMGGKIGLDSKQGAGTTFWFDLTLARGEISATATSKPRYVPTAYARILVVEDNRVNQVIALEILQQLGYLPHAVGNGIEAIAALEASTYDLVLMDCQMPEMDGFEATSIIRKSENDGVRTIPIIAMTANAMDGDREKCLSHGMNDYVSKPIDENRLVNAIETWLGRDGAVRAAPKIESVKPARAHILVVEDNVVNQEVICINLANLNCTYAVAENGVEALEIIQKENFDLVFMDCQMPEMDGYEATRRIRRMAPAWAKSIPIVAHTANAMKGDREKCLASGMSDYIAKPIDDENLKVTLEKWLKPSVSEKPKAILDLTTLDTLRSLQKPGKPDFLTNLIELFITSSDELMQSVREAHANADLSSVAKAAHALKSSGANLGATGFAAICHKLERLGRGEKFEESLEVLITQLETEYLSTVEALKGLKVAA